MMVKTSELSGAALDWAVAEALDIDRRIVKGSLYTEERFVPLNFSTDWSQGGPLIDKCGVDIVTREPFLMESWVEARCHKVKPVKVKGTHSSSPLIAACRAIVAAKLGEDVDIPDELIQAT